MSKVLVIVCLIFSSALALAADGEYRSQVVKMDVDYDGIEEEVSAFVGATPDERVVCIITVKDSNGKKMAQSSLWVGYEDSCDISLVQISPNLEPFIGVNYAEGVHGQALTMFRYVEQGEKQGILNEVATIESDKPSIQINDEDNDGIKEIVSLNRDYESPDQDYIATYKYLDDGWKRVSVYRQATKKYMPVDWDNDKASIDAYINE